LLYLCLHCFVLIRPPKDTNPFVEEIINLFYKPLEDFVNAI